MGTPMGPPRETRLELPSMRCSGSRGGQNEKRTAGVWVPVWRRRRRSEGVDRVPGVKNRGGAVYAKGAVHEQAGEETVVDPGAQGAAGEMGEERGYGRAARCARRCNGRSLGEALVEVKFESKTSSVARLA